MLVEAVTDPKILFAELEKATDPEYCFRLKYRLAYLLLNRAPKRGLLIAEELEQLALTIGTDKAKGMAFTALARCHQRAGDYELAMQLYSQALDRLEGEDAYIERGKVLDGMGMISSYIGEHEKAIALSKEAIKYFELGNDPLGMKANCMNNIGNAYARIGDSKTAVDHYTKALAVIDEYGQDRNGTHIRANMAIQMNLMGRSEEAIVEFRQCYDEFKAKGSKIGMSVAMQNMAVCHSALGEYGEAVELYVRSLIDLKLLDHQEALANGHKGLGSVYIALRGYYEAANELQIAIDIYTRLGLVNGLVDSLELLGTAYYEQGELEQAKGVWHSALHTATEKGLKGHIGVLKDRLAKLDP